MEVKTKKRFRFFEEKKNFHQRKKKQNATSPPSSLFPPLPRLQTPEGSFPRPFPHLTSIGGGGVGEDGGCGAASSSHHREL